MKTFLTLLASAVVIALAAAVPQVANGYWLSLAVTAMMYIALSTSWALFSGPTHYIALSTGAFFGIGGYLVGTGMSDYDQSFWTMAIIAPFVATLLAAFIGYVTLRLSGVYFVIFTLGLAEMIRNLVSWVQNNFLGSRGLYVLTDFDEKHIYWMLLTITVVIFAFGWSLGRSRLGFALKILGNIPLDSPFLAAFDKVGNALVQLDHPNITKYLDFFIIAAGETAATPVLIMEYVEGVTLAKKVAATAKKLVRQGVQDAEPEW